MKQIMLNLINNAIKFTETGEVSLFVTLDEETASKAKLRFRIKDSGIGIPRDRMDRLFKSFSQVDASTTRRFGGTGLGLTIAKKLAELMNGQIGVESIENKGSTFWFSVELAKQSNSAGPQALPLPSLKNKRILIVDDNRTNRFILHELLQSLNIKSDEAQTGAEALEKLDMAVKQNNRYHIAIIDMQMPGMNGITLAKEINKLKNQKDLIKIMLTSLAVKGDAQRMQEAGFNAYLTKPIKTRQLTDCLKMAVGKTTEKNPDSQILTRFSVMEQYNIRKARLLVVEDNVVNQKVALKMLEKSGFHADAVSNGREALDSLRRIPYDLVLMDIQMPVMDGFEATRAIREGQSKVINPEIPIIALTANSMKGDREKCLEAGMNDYVTKPIRRPELLDAIQRGLETIDPESA